MLAICSSTLLELNLVGFYQTWKAGVIGIGNVNGQNIYDTTGGLSDGLNVGYTELPSPSIEQYNSD